MASFFDIRLILVSKIQTQSLLYFDEYEIRRLYTIFMKDGFKKKFFYMICYIL